MKNTNETATFTVRKGYFRNDPRFGRTTVLLRNGEAVLEVLGVVGLSAITNQYLADAAK